MTEETEFSSDKLKTAPAKNKKLARLLEGAWVSFVIVKIERIEIGDVKGWQVTHRV